MAGLTVELNTVFWDGVAVARLEPGSKRPALAYDNWKVTDLAGKVISYVKRPAFRPNWKLDYGSKASYATMERALEVLLTKRGIINKKEKPSADSL